MPDLYVIEGIDGVGKGTQTTMLYDRVKEEKLFGNAEVSKLSFPAYNLPTARPVKTWIGGHIKFHYSEDAPITSVISEYKNYLLTGCSLYALNRKEVFSLIPEDDNKVYICDRYVTSNMLYSGGSLFNFVQNRCKSCSPSIIQEFANEIEKLEYDLLGLPRPKLTIYLDLPVEVALENIRRRNAIEGVRIENDIYETEEQLSITRNCASILAKYYDWVVIKCDDGHGNMLSKEAIHEAVKYTITTKALS